jgi:HD-like signal output (HDOD) protein
VSVPLAVSAGYAAIGGASVLAGAIIATRWRLPDRVRALIQHAAAGTVLAGLVIDVLAKLMHRPHQLPFTAAGMVAGLAPELGLLGVTAAGQLRPRCGFGSRKWPGL